jgi:hypothetical protein
MLLNPSSFTSFPHLSWSSRHLPEFTLSLVLQQPLSPISVILASLSANAFHLFS